MVEPPAPREPELSFPLARWLGLAIERPERGRAVAVVDASAEHVNPHGVVHGGVLFAMVDTAMGAATYDYLQPDQLCASVEVQLRFLKAAAPGGRLRADVRVVQAGRRIVQLAAEVTDGTGRLVATATGSFAVFPAASGS